MLFENVSNGWTINTVQHPKTSKTSATSVFAATSIQRRCFRLPTLHSLRKNDKPYSTSPIIPKLNSWRWR
jgi:hypothetical protein